MKKVSVLIAIICMFLTFVYSLSIISKDNECTSVRSFLCNKSQTNSDDVTNVTTQIVPQANAQNSVEENYSQTSNSNFSSGSMLSVSINNYKNGDVVTQDSIDIQVTATEGGVKPDNIKINGAGTHTLQQGINPIFVSAEDGSGNIATDYVLIEKK